MRILVALVAALIAVPALAADQLHLYNWNNYISDETIKRFEADCKCDVVQTYYSDNEELLAKLAAGAKGYDVLVPTANAVQALIKGGIPSTTSAVTKASERPSARSDLRSGVRRTVCGAPAVRRTSVATMRPPRRATAFNSHALYGTFQVRWSLPVLPLGLV